MNEAVRKGTQEAAREAAQEVKTSLVPRLDRMDTRLDRLYDTLRLMWKQMKGNGSLPIDRD